MPESSPGCPGAGRERKLKSLLAVTEAECPEHPGRSHHPSASPVGSLGAYWDVFETQRSNLASGACWIPIFRASLEQGMGVTAQDGQREVLAGMD